MAIDMGIAGSLHPARPNAAGMGGAGGGGAACH